MNDYERIARVIRYLDEHRLEQPCLADIAQHAGLSAFHFHRLFSAWAGVTPKEFLQCLTARHVRKALLSGRSILETALDAGLSGPGRLHDLCLIMEAATPGEVKSGGAGWKITAGFAECPFGICLVAKGPRGICHLSFVESGQEDSAWLQLQQEWPTANLQRNDRSAKRIAAMVFQRCANSSRRPLRAFVRGTELQLRVWRALIQVPPGSLISYGHLAAAIGSPAAARAVGTAVGANPLGYLIRWGKLRKRALVAWETASALTEIE
jgi:AraC family transcriptional regulator of adaptative response/methylated-DNA-[protein]-cysteine methyltransferase